MSVADTTAGGGLDGNTREETPPERPHRRPGPRARALLAVGIPTALLALHTWFYGRWIEDDAGITFAFARSLATGAGPVLQPGAAPVEAYSNPTWLAILVVGRWLGLFDRGALFGQPDIVLYPKLVAILCGAAMFGAFYSVARVVARRPVLVTAIAGSITAGVPSFVIWTTSGLENALFALLVVALAAVLARAAVEGRLGATRTAVVCGALAALAALSRPEGLVYAAAYPVAAVLLVHRADLRAAARTVLISVGTFLVPVGMYLVVRLIVFGDYLPNTARAKEQGLPTPGGLNKPASLIMYAGWLTVVLVVALVVLALQRRSRTRTAVAMILVPLALALSAFAFLSADWMAQYRFATPVWPLSALAVTLSAARLWSSTTVRTRAVGSVAVVIALALTATGWVAAADSFRNSPTAPMCWVARSVGQRINGYADILGIRDGSLLAVDGGGTSLTTRLRFIDLSGLADTRIARLWSADDMAGLRDLVYDVERPTFFKIDSGWAEGTRSGLLSDPRLPRDYTVVTSSGPGTQTWVRRDAVRNAQALTQAQQWARDMRVQVDTPWLASDRTRWLCGPTLRVGS